MILKSLIVSLFSLSMALSATMSFDSSTVVGFRIQKNKIGEPVTGKFTQFQGTTEMSEDGSQLRKVMLRAEAKSIDTDNAKRDEHLRGADFFNVTKEGYEDLTFTSTKPATIADNFKLTGKLKINNVTKVVVFDVVKKGAKKFAAKTTIDKRDYGLDWNRPLDEGTIAKLVKKIKGFAAKKVLGEKVEINLDVVLK